MKIISLDGEWSLFGFPEGEVRVNHPGEINQLDIDRIESIVPGNVELDLLKAGRIEDPFYGSNIQKLRALEGFEWWYVRDFDFPDKHLEQEWNLVCEGLDTIAQIWINGILVGCSENALIGHTFSVTHALKPGQPNSIAIQLRSVMKAARDYRYEPSMMSWEGRDEGLYIRKPPHCWGWDIMPRVLSAGIWRSIRLESCPLEAIEKLYFWTAGIGVGNAHLGVHYQVRSQEKDLVGCSLLFHGVCGSHTFTYEHPIEFVTGRCIVPIPNPQLWWPKGYGQANLYQVKVQLIRDDEILSERVEYIGLRTIKLIGSLRNSETRYIWNGNVPSRFDIEPDRDGKFMFIVNNEPIMIKGTNWVPLDAFHSRDLQRLPQAMEMIDDLKCNMIRCWGGNVYESDAFFNLCDQKGILVWQDFSFACCRYPQTDNFFAQVEQEAVSVIHRLRNHPSLAVWCGDNEIDMAYVSEGLSPEQNRISRTVLPRVVHRCDPYRPYVPSSPYVSPDAFSILNPMANTPEQHLWGPRGYFKSDFYSGHKAHFIGEIGYHGCPAPDSIARFISPERVWPWKGNDEWKIHSTYHWLNSANDRDRIKLMVNQIQEFFGKVPNELDLFSVASQITQAEAVKYFIESTRLRKWQTSGILWWNLVDGWPQFSDAVVDYYFKKKLAYYYIRRVQQPVCLIIGDEVNKYLPVVASNDSLQPVHINFRIRYSGDKNFCLEGDGMIPPNQNWCLERIRSFASDVRMILMDWELDGKVYSNHHLVGYPPINLEDYLSWLNDIKHQADAFDFSF